MRATARPTFASPGACGAALRGGSAAFLRTGSRTSTVHRVLAHPLLTVSTGKSTTVTDNAADVFGHDAVRTPVSFMMRR